MNGSSYIEELPLKQYRVCLVSSLAVQCCSMLVTRLRILLGPWWLPRTTLYAPLKPSLLLDTLIQTRCKSAINATIIKALTRLASPQEALDLPQS